jgi:hypothetical protein
MRNLKRNIEVPDEKVVEMLKKKSPQERLAIAFSLWRSTRLTLTNHLRVTHPDWDEKGVQAEAARRMSHGAV